MKLSSIHSRNWTDWQGGFKLLKLGTMYRSLKLGKRIDRTKKTIAVIGLYFF
jgi:hypothetical protein